MILKTPEKFCLYESIGKLLPGEVVFVVLLIVKSVCVCVCVCRVYYEKRGKKMQNTEKRKEKGTEKKEEKLNK